MSSTTLPIARTVRGAFAGLRSLRSLHSLWQRWFLWVILAVLVIALLATVVWLASRPEVEQVQTAMDRDTADAVSDLRSGLQRLSRYTSLISPTTSIGMDAPTTSLGMDVGHDACRITSGMPSRPQRW